MIGALDNMSLDTGNGTAQHKVTTMTELNLHTPFYTRLLSDTLYQRQLTVSAEANEETKRGSLKLAVRLGGWSQSDGLNTWMRKAAIFLGQSTSISHFRR